MTSIKHWALLPVLVALLSSPLAQAQTASSEKAWTIAGSLGASQLSGLGSYCDGTTKCTTRPVGWALVLGKGLGSGWSVEASVREFGEFKGRIPSDPAKFDSFEPFEDPQPNVGRLSAMNLALSMAYRHDLTPLLSVKARLGLGASLTSYSGYSKTESFADIFDVFGGLQAHDTPNLGMELGYALNTDWQLTAAVDHVRARASAKSGDYQSKVFNLTQYSLGARYTF